MVSFERYDQVGINRIFSIYLSYDTRTAVIPPFVFLDTPKKRTFEDISLFFIYDISCLILIFSVSIYISYLFSNILSIVSVLLFP